MRETIDFALAIVFSSSLFFGGGYTAKQIYDHIKRECVEQVSKGLSSSEELANALTGEKLSF